MTADLRHLSHAITIALQPVARNACVTVKPDRTWGGGKTTTVITIEHTVGDEKVVADATFDRTATADAMANWAVYAVRIGMGARTPLSAPRMTPDMTPARPYVAFRNSDGTVGGGG